MASEYETWGERRWWVILSSVFVRLFCCGLCLLVIPSSAFDCIWIWLWAHLVQALLLLAVFSTEFDASNVLTPLCIGAWVAAPLLSTWISGVSVAHRLLEGLISFIMYAY